MKQKYGGSKDCEIEKTGEHNKNRGARKKVWGVKQKYGGLLNKKPAHSTKYSGSNIEIWGIKKQYGGSKTNTGGLKWAMTKNGGSQRKNGGSTTRNGG